MKTPQSTSQSLDSSSTRRQFMGTGGTALAGLGLLGMGAANAQAQSPEAVKTLFSAPMDADGDYALPPLPYAYDALDPSIDAETMRLHHDIHFRGYMSGLNAALAKLKSFRESGDYPEIAYWENSLAFNGAGYSLHSVFFEGMAPAGSSKPTKAFNSQLERYFGTVDAFKAQLSKAAQTVQGSGWGILGWEPLGNRLVILQVLLHQNQTMWNIIPIMALDVWEHAYYLKYQNRRGDYIKNWWKVVDWDYAARRLDAAQSLS